LPPIDSGLVIFVKGDMKTAMAMWPDIWDGVMFLYVVKSRGSHPKYRATGSALVFDRHIALYENDKTSVKQSSFACLPSAPEGYAGQVILNKNPHLWMDINSDLNMFFVFSKFRAFVINFFLVSGWIR